MRISDWSSDVCSSDLKVFANPHKIPIIDQKTVDIAMSSRRLMMSARYPAGSAQRLNNKTNESPSNRLIRSEEHTSELQSLMRISYAVFCLKKKTIKTHTLT